MYQEWRYLSTVSTLMTLTLEGLAVTCRNNRGGSQEPYNVFRNCGARQAKKVAGLYGIVSTLNHFSGIPKQPLAGTNQGSYSHSSGSLVLRSRKGPRTSLHSLELHAYSITPAYPSRSSSLFRQYVRLLNTPVYLRCCHVSQGITSNLLWAIR